jgi:DNA polymerase III, gamma/tau subunits
MVEMRPMPGVSAELGAGIRRQWIEQARPGALLVTGATQSARQEAADWLIQAILCEGKPSLRPCGNCWSCRQFNLGQHPDLHAIQSDLEHVGIDEIRELGDALALTAHRATRKIG